MKCVGCGAEAESHPIVAVAAAGDIEGDSIGQNGKWSAHPVCAECHRDPAHRTQQLKAHFFEIAQLPRALAMAGSSTIGMQQ